MSAAIVIAFFATASAVSSGISIKALAAARAYEPPDPIAASDKTCSVVMQMKYDYDAQCCLCITYL